MKVNSGDSNGRFGKIAGDIGTDCYLIKVQFSDEDDFDLCHPEELTKVEQQRSIRKNRKFRKGDKVRYVPSGREDYVNQPDEDKIYEVCANERDLGWVDLKGNGYSNCVKWFDLELVKGVEDDKFAISVLTPCVQVICVDDKSYVHEIWWKNGSVPHSPYTKEEAIALAKDICDKLNEMEA